MPRKRSRATTEGRFQDAVIELVAESGCGNLGVNAIAQRAGADKVLIYRYFKDLEGLLERVAESHSWLPVAEETAVSLSGTPYQVLTKLSRRVVDHITSNRAAHQLARWRHAVENPLTVQYSSDWRHFWQEIPEVLAQGLSFTARQDWKNACMLLAFAIEAEINGESIHPGALEAIAETLEPVPAIVDQEHDEIADDDSLPTNLL
jgi:AcrR family transcriptional regulator